MSAMLGLSPNTASNLWSSLLDCLYPPACIVCRSSGFWCCKNCLATIRPTTEQPEHPGIDRVIVLGSYADPVLRKLLTSYKYNSATCLEASLEKAIQKLVHLKGLVSWDARWTICPIPSSEKHILERGFDHTEHLAVIMQQIIACESKVVSILKRVRNSEANANLPTDGTRAGNVRGAFATLQRMDGPVLLIDDVYTTGATAGECARVLKEAGASRVEVLTLALGG